MSLISTAVACVYQCPPAISRLGAFRTPAARARGWSLHSGVRKPAQEETLKGHSVGRCNFSASICCKNNDGNCLISRKNINR
jgi:hypothetical protein